jgi:hypothetical protein
MEVNIQKTAELIAYLTAARDILSPRGVGLSQNSRNRVYEFLGNNNDFNSVLADGAKYAENRKNLQDRFEGLKSQTSVSSLIDILRGSRLDTKA